MTVTLDIPVDAPAFAPCARTWLRHDEGVCLRPRVARYYPETVVWTNG